MSPAVLGEPYLGFERGGEGVMSEGVMSEAVMSEGVMSDE